MQKRIILHFKVKLHELKKDLRDEFTVKQEMKLRDWGWLVQVRISKL